MLPDASAMAESSGLASQSCAADDVGRPIGLMPDSHEQTSPCDAPTIPKVSTSDSGIGTDVQICSMAMLTTYPVTVDVRILGRNAILSSRNQSSPHMMSDGTRPNQ